jgi:uncharacterized membrane protein
MGVERHIVADRAVGSSQDLRTSLTGVSSAAPSLKASPEESAMTTLEQATTTARRIGEDRLAAPLERRVVVIEFPDVFRAQEAMLAAARLERRLSIVLNDTAVVTRDTGGVIRVNRGGRPSPWTTAPTAAAAAGFPALWLAGPWIALPVGAIAGLVAALWSRAAVGFRPRFLRRIGRRLAPGTAAGCFLVSHAHLAHVLAEVRRFEGRLVHSTLPREIDSELSEALAAD